MSNQIKTLKKHALNYNYDWNIHKDSYISDPYAFMNIQRSSKNDPLDMANIASLYNEFQRQFNISPNTVIVPRRFSTESVFSLLGCEIFYADVSAIEFALMVSSALNKAPKQEVRKIETIIREVPDYVVPESEHFLKQSEIDFPNDLSHKKKNILAMVLSHYSLKKDFQIIELSFEDNRLKFYVEFDGMDEQDTKDFEKIEKAINE